MRELAQLEYLLNHVPHWWGTDQHFPCQVESGPRIEIVDALTSHRWRVTWPDGRVETSPQPFNSIAAAKAALRRRLEIRVGYLAELEANPVAVKSS